MINPSTQKVQVEPKRDRSQKSVEFSHARGRTIPTAAREFYFKADGVPRRIIPFQPRSTVSRRRNPLRRLLTNLSRGLQKLLHQLTPRRSRRGRRSIPLPR